MVGLEDGFELGDGLGQALLLERRDRVVERLDVVRDGAGAALAGQGRTEDSHSADRGALIHDRGTHVKGLG